MSDLADVRERIAVEHGIDPDDVLLSGADEETLRAQAQRIARFGAVVAPVGNCVPREGSNPDVRNRRDHDLRSFVRALFGGEAY